MTKVTDLRDKKDFKVINLNNTSQGGIDFFEGLTLMLIGLKLTDHLQDWTWIGVLSPIIIPFMIGWFLKLVRITFFNSKDESDDD